MIVLALALRALAGEPEATTVQRIHELEWARGPAVDFVAQLAGGDTATRVAAIRALGRLRSPDALEAVATFRDDAAREVRVAVAEALGTTPGSEPLLREWLEELVPPSSPRALADESDGVIVALLGALGNQGQARELGVLLGALEEPWPLGSAAARALGKLGTRTSGKDRVAAIDAAVSPLVRRLDAVDPRIVADAAWALSRIGLEPATPAELAVVERRIRGGSLETARAWLVKAGWPAFAPETRDALFVRLATDPSRLVRVALLAALKPEDAAPEVLGAWLVDPDPWVRSATIDALGREGSAEARASLLRHALEAPDPWERAHAVQALDPAGGAVEVGEDAPLPVRAARVASLRDRAAWVRLAKDATEAPLRTAAADALLSDPDTPWTVGEELLGASDAAIREAGIALVERAEPAKRAQLLMVHLRVETATDVLAAALAGLVEALRDDPKVGKDRGLDAVLERMATEADPRVHAAARELAVATGRPPPPARPAPEGEREIVLPGGEVVAVAAGRPAVGEAERIRGALVETSRGRFRIALDPESAPLAVWNFAALAERRYFDGMVWHRVVPGFVAQTGCPRGDGWGGPGYVLPDETSMLPFGEGAVGMARGEQRDSGGSQWFVVTSPQPHLVSEYTRFGVVVEGMEVVKRLGVGDTVVSVRIERLDP